MSQNWKNIHPDFDKFRLWSEYFQWQWKNSGFDYQQTKAWIRADLRPWEYNIAWYLVKQENINPEQLDRNSITKAKKDIGDKIRSEWKEFLYDGYSDKKKEAIEWLKRGFSYQEAKQWLAKGLKTDEYDFADYLSKNPDSSLSSSDYHNAQIWLDLNYPQIERDKIKELVINNHNLIGVLKIENFSNLEELYCPDNKLINLEIVNCPQLKTILTQQNQLTNLTIVNCPNIEKIVANKNQLTNLDFLQNLAPEKLEILNISGNNIADSDLTSFRQFTNLKHLGLGNWYKEIIDKGILNRFNGSLEPCKNLTQLEELDLAGTDVESGQEYLPDSINILYLLSKERPDSKSKLIAEELKKHGETNKDRHEDDDFALLLRKTREKIKSDLISNIPSDKLYLIKTNIEKFFYKWGDGEIKKLKVWTSRNELYGKMNSSLQWTNRIASVVGGSLLLLNSNEGGDNIIYNQTGGIIAVIAPFIETVTSNFEKNFSEEKKRRWEEFSQDAKNLFANCRDLEKLIPITFSSYPQKIKKALQNLNVKTYDLLAEYDKDKNLEIDNKEWEKARKQFPTDLKDNWERKTETILKEILKSMANLEEKIKEVHQGVFYELNEIEKTKKDAKEQIARLMQKNNLDEDNLSKLLRSLSISNDNWEEHLESFIDSKKIEDFVKNFRNKIAEKNQELKNQIIQF